MVLENCDIRIHPSQNAGFEEAVQRAIDTVGKRIKGFQGCRVLRGIDSPDRYLLQLSWDTLEDHTVDFRQGPLFAEWMAIIGAYVAGPPAVEHFQVVLA